MKKLSIRYRIIKAAVKFFYPAVDVLGTENLPDEPCVVVGNHCQMDGPIACELYFPGEHYIWCAGEMTKVKTIPGYAYKDFWSQKPVWIRWLFKIASYLITPLAAAMFGKGGANVIPVYHDTRALSTFRDTIARLKEGANVIIFPEHGAPVNNVLYDFNDRFIDLASAYYKQTGSRMKFVPMYVAPALRQVHLGKPVEYDPDVPKDGERRRIKDYLMSSITETARSLPEHRVVPYRNIGKKNYPGNLSEKPFGRMRRRPEVDYRQLTPKGIFTDKRFTHLKLLGGWIVYFALYFLTENLIPAERCHVIHCALDDVIKFDERWLIFYCAWYVWIVFSLLYFLLYDVGSFRKLQTYFMIVQALAVIVYIVYPSVQMLRPESFERTNLLTALMGFIYRFDTPTGVCPSLHVAYSVGICTAWLKRRETTSGNKLLLVLLCVLISISTTFVKQHSVVDIFAAIPLCVVAYVLIFSKVKGLPAKLQAAIERI